MAKYLVEILESEIYEFKIKASSEYEAENIARRYMDTDIRKQAHRGYETKYNVFKLKETK